MIKKCEVMKSTAPIAHVVSVTVAAVEKQTVRDVRFAATTSPFVDPL
jgi:hypothetical protein